MTAFAVQLLEHPPARAEGEVVGDHPRSCISPGSHRWTRRRSIPLDDSTAVGQEVKPLRSDGADFSPVPSEREDAFDGGPEWVGRQHSRPASTSGGVRPSTGAPPAEHRNCRSRRPRLLDTATEHVAHRVDFAASPQAVIVLCSEAEC